MALEMLRLAVSRPNCFLCWSRFSEERREVQATSWIFVSSHKLLTTVTRGKKGREIVYLPGVFLFERFSPHDFIHNSES